MSTMWKGSSNAAPKRLKIRLCASSMRHGRGSRSSRSTGTCSADVTLVSSTGALLLSRVRDALQAAANPIADYTVFLSQWLESYESERWFDRARPHTIVRNGADPRFFHPIGAAAYSRGPLRLVTHHWSRHWNKGFDVYVEL